MGNTFDHEHSYPGRLIIVEGIDGSGKSTQIQLLQKWLVSMGYRVFFTEWNSSALVKETIRRGKKKNLLTPTTFSILHATDFADRLAHLILPPLKAGMIVLADRYVFTAFARDVVRGVHPEWVRQMYGFAVRPDLAFYFKVPIEVSLKRILVGRASLKFHEAGMDLGLSDDPKESFKIFQSKIIEEYNAIADEFKLVVMDATKPIYSQQAIVREFVQEKLQNYTGIPYTSVLSDEQAKR
ncbi:MAG: dTMP kinase [Ignavibacteriae bacterium]|nr:dTMP kinase [Ignavibacteriota bacterium]